MPQLNCQSSNEAEPTTAADESNNDANSETVTYRQRLRIRSKNAAPEMEEKILPKKTVKRKQPEKKKPAAKSPKSRVSKKNLETAKKNSQADVQQIEFKIKKEDQKNVGVDDDDDDEEDMEEGEIPSSIAAESRTFYSCKLCHKDFSSAFILCLHLQIHEKVASTKMPEEDSTVAIEKECQTVTIKAENDNDADTNVKTEEAEQESGLIKVENCNPSGLINKNFVENLKRNLSLAMSRNNL